MVTTTIDDVVYQGEGTNSQIARAIAAHKALVGMNVSTFTAGFGIRKSHSKSGIRVFYCRRYLSFNVYLLPTYVT